MARSSRITRVADTEGMPLEPLSTPWTGVVFRHIAAEARYSVLDFSRAGKATNNRWNVKGEPTLYLASDRSVGITEFSRHIDRDRPPAVVAGVLQRRLYRFEIRLDAVLDLLQPQTWTALSLADAPNCFLDRRIARATAHYIRATTTIQAIRVPSIAFLDDLTRWVLVVFLDKLASDPGKFILSGDPDDVFTIRP